MNYHRENMIDLNEENIRSIFSDCIATEQTPVEDIISTNFISSDIQTPIPSIQLSRSRLSENSLTMYYLTGQLDNVHSGKSTFHVNDGFKKYDGSCNRRSPTATGAVVNGHSAVRQRPA